MKRWINKQYLAFLLAFVLAFVSMAVPSVPVKAAETEPKSPPFETVLVNYGNNKITVFLSTKGAIEADTLYFALGTATKPPAESKYDFYPVKKGESRITFDISWVPRTKDQYLYICTDPKAANQTPFQVEIPKQQGLFAKFEPKLPSGVKESDTIHVTDYNELGIGTTDSSYGYIVVKLGTSYNRGIVIPPTHLYWREGDKGDWALGTMLDLRKYSLKGASLQFKLLEYDFFFDQSGIPVDVHSSKIAKLKLPAQSAAPNPVINYLERTIKFPKGSEYRTIVSEKENAWTQVKDTSVLTFDQMAGVNSFDGEHGFLLEVRKAATERAKASKIKRINLKVNMAIEGITTGSASTVTEVPALIVASKAGLDKEALFTAEYKKTYDERSGIVFTNKTDKVYQVAVVNGTEMKIATGSSAGTITSQASITLTGKDKIRWVTVKGKTKQGNPTKVTYAATKYKNIKNLEDAVILYRVQGANTKTLTSDVASSQMPAKAEQSVEVVSNASIGVTGEQKKDSKVIPATAEVYVGEAITIDLKATSMSATKVTPKFEYYTDEKCTSKDSSKKALASVVSGKQIQSGSGQIKVTPKTTGTTYIKIIAEGASCILKVEVKEARGKQANIQSVSVNGGSVSITPNKGASRTIKISVTSGAGVATTGVVPLSITYAENSKNATVEVTKNSGVTVKSYEKKAPNRIEFTVTEGKITKSMELGTIKVTSENGQVSVTYTVKIELKEK